MAKKAFPKMGTAAINFCLKAVGGWDNPGLANCNIQKESTLRLRASEKQKILLKMQYGKDKITSVDAPVSPSVICSSKKESVVHFICLKCSTTLYFLSQCGQAIQVNF
ncbi:hypothetical protein ACH5RR_005442 [Cinchona calisaya]|uniref:Uncharacterized protein n=1 Tax=Cinchona calisaya TaxID=153742 RepID=A0ABD3ALF5_9GENT